MNKVFKIIWNKTTQSFVVTSELAKGAVKASSNSEQRVTSETRLSSLFKLSVFALSLSAVMMPAQAVDLSTPLIKITAGSGNMFTGEADAGGGSNIAIGNNATVANKNAFGRNIAIGLGAHVSGTYSQESIAIGSAGDGPTTQRTEVRGDQSIAIGANTLAQGNSSIAIGNDDLNKVGASTYTGEEKFIKYDESGNKTGEYTLKGKALRNIYQEMTGDTMNHGAYTSTTSGEGAVAIGVQAYSPAALSLAIGTKAKASTFGATALGTGAKADKLNSVALGTASVISKAGQAYVERTILGTTYTWAGGAQVDEGDVVSIGNKGYERQIINLAPGDISATSTDAINGSQLYATQDVINNVAGSVTNILGGTAQVDNKGNITMTDIGGTGENTVHDAIKSHTVKINENADNIARLEKKLPEVQAGDNTVVTTSTDENGKITYTVSSKDFQPAIDANKAKIAENAKAITANTADIRSAEALISKNAKDIAQNTKDIAANTDYIKAVEQKLPVVAAGKNTTVDVATDANGKVTYTVNSTDFQPAIDKNAKGIADNTKAIDANTAKIADVEKEAQRHAKVEAGHNMEVTSSKDENGATVYKVATSKDIGVNSLTVYNGPKITKDGIDARNTKIKNVTAGEDDNDAVNVSQLNQVKARQDAQSHVLKQVRHTVINHGARLANVENRVTGLENKVDRLDRDVKKNRKRADAGISAVAAMANIPQVYLPGKSGVGVGAGYKHGQSAIAVGYSRSSDNGHHIIKLSAGVDTQKDVTLGAGYMYQW